MTRQLDILEDYCIFRGYKFCRIDGNTEGEVRDASVEAFNAPGSELFMFLLRFGDTRAWACAWGWWGWGARVGRG
jgi:SNF2 family DNA or RNA helicase